ncbi:MAG: hypothetical protein ACFFDS_05920 [Candidatus Thorarchaeota archaeon]
MTKTLWAIFWSTLHITYLVVLLPYLFLYLIISGSTRKSRNKIIIRRELKRFGISRDFRREIAKSYGNGLSLSNLIKISSLKDSPKEIKKFIKTSKTVIK